MTPRPPAPPETLDELLLRARGLAGISIAELAKSLGHRAPRDLRGHKGFMGNLVELALGASAGSEPEPDFPALGVELKTLPVSELGRPVESTYVCMARLDGREATTFEASFVAHKLRRVLFVPIVEAATVAARCLGMPFLWQPEAADMARLAADFEMLAAQVRQGGVEVVRGHDGVILQLRPKAMSRDDRTLGVSEDGWLVEVRPRAWYLRTSFTAELIARAFPRQTATDQAPAENS